jgi:FkbM family methyltransferase
MEWIEEQLTRAPTPAMIVHLGAGHCSELQSYLDSGAQRIVLVEPNPEMHPELASYAEAHANVTVLPVAVSAEAGKRTLRTFNYADLSSLRRPTGLFQLLPGIRQTGQVVVDTVAVHELPEQLGLNNDQNNWLVLDTPGEEAAIITALEQSRQLNQFDRIIICAGAESYYEGASTAPQIFRQIQQLGYQTEGGIDDSDQDWPRCHLRLNPEAIECRRLKRKVESLTAENEALKKRSRELSEELELQAQSLQERSKELETVRQQSEDQQKDLLAENQGLKSKIESFEASRRQATSDCKAFQARLEALAKDKEKLERENSGLREQVAKHRSTEELLAGLQKSITRHIQQSRIQIESYMALHKYLDYGELTPPLHGWTISPDLALHLVDMLENENYDLVIEFGSGSSTVLLAQAMKQRATQTSRVGQLIGQLALEDHGAEEIGGRQLSVQSRSDSFEIPNWILAFEHSRKYLQQTEQMLGKSGVRPYVDLEYAPLKDFKWEDQQYLFYDCLDTLEKVARMIQRERSKVLVLVDGPPGATNAHARYPALPLLLEFFSKHQLHVVLDDFGRAEEVEIVEMWRGELARRSIQYEIDKLPFEKGACILRVG